MAQSDKEKEQRPEHERRSASLRTLAAATVASVASSTRNGDTEQQDTRGGSYPMRRTVAALGQQHDAPKQDFSAYPISSTVTAFGRDEKRASALVGDCPMITRLEQYRHENTGRADGAAAGNAKDAAIWKSTRRTTQKRWYMLAMAGFAIVPCLLLARNGPALWSHLETVVFGGSAKHVAETTSASSVPLEASKGTSSRIVAVAPLRDPQPPEQPAATPERLPEDSATVHASASGKVKVRPDAARVRIPTGGLEVRDVDPAASRATKLEAPASDPVAAVQAQAAPSFQASPHNVQEPVAAETGIARSPVAKPEIEPRRVAAILIEARRLMERGDVRGARALLERAANAGRADAALALGSTYDKKSLAADGMTTVVPDKEKALHWYRRAHALTEKNTIEDNAGHTPADK